MPINCQYLEKLSVSGKLRRAWGVSRLSFSGWIQIELMVMTLSASVQTLCPAKHLIRKVSEPPKVKESQVKQRIIAMSCYIRKFANNHLTAWCQIQHSPPHSSLSQVCQTQSRVAKSGYTGSSIHSESGHQPPTMSPSLSVFFFFVSRLPVVTRLWTGGCAGVSIDPQWQVASEPVAWRQCLGRLDREGQLHLRQTRDRPDPVPRWRDWGEVGDCNVSWNYFLTRKGFLQRFAFIMCAFICQQAHNRHWANGQDWTDSGLMQDFSGKRYSVRLKTALQRAWNISVLIHILNRNVKQ